MAENITPENMLGPYRVLDLAGEMGLLCGKILGDLGADVIKIEKPGGDPARNQGPFYQDDPDPEKSLLWFALNTSKRGITLDIETVQGQELFRKLAEKADFVIETFRPGFLAGLGLGYSDLEKINPGLIMVSVTPFGQTGPWKDYKTSDIVAWGLGGEMAPFISAIIRRPILTPAAMPPRAPLQLSIIAGQRARASRWTSRCRSPWCSARNTSLPPGT